MVDSLASPVERLTKFDDIREQVTDLIGALFVPKGAGPGYDCWGLVCEVRRRLGLPTEYPVYTPEQVLQPDFCGQRFALGIAQGDWVPCAAVVGAVVLLRNAPGGWYNHTGVMVAPELFLHTLKGIGAHLASTTSPAWRRRIAGYYTWTTHSTSPANPSVAS
jgi:hypothetical protein